MSTKDLEMQLNGSSMVITGKQLSTHLLPQLAFFSRVNSRKAGICSPTQKPTWASMRRYRRWKKRWESTPRNCSQWISTTALHLICLYQCSEEHKADTPSHLISTTSSVKMKSQMPQSTLLSAELVALRLSISLPEPAKASIACTLATGKTRWVPATNVQCTWCNTKERDTLSATFA